MFAQRLCLNKRTVHIKKVIRSYLRRVIFLACIVTEISMSYTISSVFLKVQFKVTQRKFIRMHNNVLTKPLIEKVKFYGDATKTYETSLSP